MKKKEESLTKTEFIHVFISLPTTEVCSLRDISTKLLVHQIKSKIELRVGLPGDLIHLYFMNDELADEKTLQDYKLKHGCILRVRLHKLGWAFSSPVPRETRLMCFRMESKP